MLWQEFLNTLWLTYESTEGFKFDIGVSTMGPSFKFSEGSWNGSLLVQMIKFHQGKYRDSPSSPYGTRKFESGCQHLIQDIYVVAFYLSVSSRESEDKILMVWLIKTN